MIRVDPHAVIGRIDPNIYGMFIEHLGRCIYGGIYDEGSALSDSDGYRLDVLRACQQLAPPLLRWPGGNFVSGYHWQDGVGPVENRPRRFDLAWLAEESNRFGTDEFLGFCRRLNTQPFICVNTGTGTMDEAVGWVEYCNGWTNTYYANMRRRNGNAVPFNVPYWGLGNEVYGSWQIGHRGPQEYADQAREYAKVMRLVDPNIKLVAVGVGKPEWDVPVLQTTRGHAEYLSVHCYTGDPDHYRNLAGIHKMEDILQSAADALCTVYEVARPEEAPVRLSMDEWNVWYRKRGNERMAPNKLEEIYDLSDALMVATCVHLFQRWCRVVTMANLAQMVNVIAPILTSPDGLLLQSIYYPLVLLRQHSGPIAVTTDVTCDSADRETTGHRCLPYLDAAATLSEDARTLYLSVVNRHATDALEGELLVTGATETWQCAWQVNGPDVHASNTFADPDVVTARPVSVPSRSRYLFPAHSHTVLEASLS